MRGEAEQLRQLSDDDRDREAVHVSDLHLLREQVGDEPELAEPEADLGEPDQHRQHAGQRDRRARVSARQQRRDRGEDQRRDRRVGAEHEHPRGPEHRVADQARDRRVEAGDRREPGQLARRPCPAGRGSPPARPRPRDPVAATRADRCGARERPAPSARRESRVPRSCRRLARPDRRRVAGRPTGQARGEHAGADARSRRRPPRRSGSARPCARASRRPRPPTGRAAARVPAARRRRRWRTRTPRRCGRMGRTSSAACGSASGASVRAGRRRRASSLAGPFDTAAAIAIAMMPRPAALRPGRPPQAASTPAIRSHSRE